MKDCALVVVDMLYDFIDGTMACAGTADAVVKLRKFIDEKVSQTPENDEVIYGSFPVAFVCDSHPADHCSFKEQGGPWPPHCEKGTRGAAVHEELEAFREDALSFYKGCDPGLEQYSGFCGMNDAGQSLGEVLELLEIRNVFVAGIATEYCVLETASELKNAGFEVFVLKECLGYVSWDGHVAALAQMEASGVRIV